jgi:CheY-like chemotaxis protein
VLLVEDDDMVLSYGKVLLEHLGYQFLSAAHPDEALRLAWEHPGKIHLLITDVIMPTMNGRELADQILALRPGLKYVFTSGYTANVIAHHGVLDAGVNFIPKPFRLADLAVKVREALEK